MPRIDHIMAHPSSSRHQSDFSLHQLSNIEMVLVNMCKHPLGLFGLICRLFADHKYVVKNILLSK